MNLHAVSDRTEAPVTHLVVVEETRVVAVQMRGRLPMRSAMLEPAVAEYRPAVKQSYYWR